MTIKLEAPIRQASSHWLRERFQLIDRIIENELLSQLIIDNDNHRQGGRRGIPRLPPDFVEQGQKPTAQKAAWIRFIALKPF